MAPVCRSNELLTIYILRSRSPSLAIFTFYNKLHQKGKCRSRKGWKFLNFGLDLYKKNGTHNNKNTFFKIDTSNNWKLKLVPPAIVCFMHFSRRLASQPSLQLYGVEAPLLTPFTTRLPGICLTNRIILSQPSVSVGT